MRKKAVLLAVIASGSAGIGIGLWANGTGSHRGTQGSTAPLPSDQVPAASPTVPATGPQPVPFEMISPSHLRDLVSAGLPPSVASYFFDTPHAMLSVGANGKTVTAKLVSDVHRKYPEARIGWLFNSFGTNTLTGRPGIEAVLSSDAVASGISYIQYDPEGAENGTPPEESSALERGDTSYVARAAALAKAAGLQFYFTPSIDVGMTASQGAYPAKYTTWLTQDRGRWASIPGVDLYSIQSQQAEGTPTFDQFVPAALAEARAAAPGTPVDVGIGINPSNPPTAITSTDLMSAYQLATHDGANGFWNNVEIGVGAHVPTSVYVTFFEQLYGQLHG